ncbi:hypothetical protein L6452_01032 [Arctium lappa]|uniref:Uncharacterized protein n=1 Tax=Arctium lappa TaxID=4217 RepID=A0ACB9FG62_ARCLA|nr:hypothetical protein L6452_01032 [Arctium lappa]
MLRGCALKRVACWLEAVNAGSLANIPHRTLLQTLSPPSRIAGNPSLPLFKVLHGGCLFFVKEVDLAITADLKRLPVERHGVGSKGVGTCFQVLRQIWMKAFERLRRVEMGLISTFLGFSGFGIGVSAGLVIGCYLFIYFQPTDVKAICKTAKDIAKPIINNEQVPKYKIDSVEFETLTLGSLPPTFQGNVLRLLWLPRACF